MSSDSGVANDETDPPRGSEVLGQAPQFLGSVEPQEDHDHASNHFALIYENRENQFAAALPFIRQGIERGEQCLYVADENSQETVLKAMRDYGIDVDTALESGALSVLTPADTYRRTGEFDRGAMLEFWEDALKQATDSDYTGIRAAAEMTWALDDDTTTDQLTEYEAVLNHLYENEDYTVLCQYNRERFSPELIHGVIKTHPYLIADDTVSHNAYYTPPEKFFDSEKTDEKVDRMLQTLEDRTKAKAKLKENEQHLRELYHISADTDLTFEEKLQVLFDIGCERLDLELGGMARIDPDSDLFEVVAMSGDHEHLQPGTQVALSETYCRVHESDSDTVGISTPLDDGFDGSKAYTEFSIRSYIGTQISLENELDRTLFFVSTEPQEVEFTESEHTFLHLMGQWVQYELERRHDAEQLAALNRLNQVAREINQQLAHQSTREEIEQVVCEGLAESDSYEFAWTGTVDEDSKEIVPSTTANTRGYLDDVTITVDDSPTGQGPGGTAVRTGDPQVVQNLPESLSLDSWCEAVRDRGVNTLASVPIAYDDQQYGILNVYTSREQAFEENECDVVTQLGEIMGLAIAAVEREQQLQYERERLEFVNRLLRHNLLNGLNAAQAHASLLEPHVGGEGNHHLETIRDRLGDMTDLITTMRSLMKMISDEDQVLQPVDLDDILGDKLEQARKTYPDAQFELRGTRDESVDVLANDLLAEVFENLLVNAVEHNDADTPAVTVTIEGTSETVTIHVTDNGPGIPDDLKDRVFEKGEKDFDSPGTGFGLYLAREIVESFEGTISVADNDPTGAVFSVTLDRP